MNNYYDIPINQLDFSKEILAILNEQNIHSVGSLLDTESDKIKTFEGITQKKYNEITAFTSAVVDFSLSPQVIGEIYSVQNKPLQ